MSLLTRCPACQTVYRVVADQLRVSGGWVRCGHCGEVFDGHAHLVEMPAVDPPPEPPMPLLRRESESGEANALPSSEPDAPAVQPDDDLAVDAPVAAGDEPVTGPPAEPSLAAESPSSAALEIGTVVPAFDRSAGEGAAVDAASPGTGVEPGTVVVENLSFLRDSKPGSGGRRRGAGMLWSLIGLLLALGLAGQWVYQERDRLAAIWPASKPVLQALCQPVGCRIQPLRRPESLVIDASSFTQAGAGSYRLSFIVKNTGQLALARPHVELTLTDSLDRIVVRRVLTPLDLGANSDAIAGESEWPVSLLMHVQIASAQVLGYRLMAFYP